MYDDRTVKVMQSHHVFHEFSFFFSFFKLNFMCPGCWFVERCHYCVWKAACAAPDTVFWSCKLACSGQEAAFGWVVCRQPLLYQLVGHMDSLSVKCWCCYACSSLPMMIGAPVSAHLAIVWWRLQVLWGIWSDWVNMWVGWVLVHSGSDWLTQIRALKSFVSTPGSLTIKEVKV